MSHNKMGTTIGGHLAWHSGNLEAFFKAVADKKLNMGQVRLSSGGKTIGGINMANGALLIDDMAIDGNEIVGASEMLIGTVTAGGKVAFRNGTSERFVIYNSLVKSNFNFQAPKAMLGGSQTPLITCALGDADTGFKWVSDGKFETYANNVVIDEVTNTGRRLLKPINANGQNISNVNNLTANYLARGSHNSGYMIGSYNNVGANNSNTNPIYTIGSNYKPSTTALGNMYGIGFAESAAPFLATSKSLGASGWGMYVAHSGSVGTFISGAGGIFGQGHLRMKGQVRGDAGLFWGGQSTDDRYIRKAVSSQTIDGGDNTSLTLKSNDKGISEIRLYGDVQGAGRVFVGQNNADGGGIEYNGDNNPVTTGAGADYINLYRGRGGAYTWTARNQLDSNDWEFRGKVSAAWFETVNGRAFFRRNNSAPTLHACQQGSGWIADFRAGSGDGSTKSYIMNDGTFVSKAGVVVNASNPTIRLQDTDGKSSFLHQNNDVFHILRSAGNNGTSWDVGPNSRYPMKLYLNNGDCIFSGNVQGYSDRRLKEEIVNIPDALDKIDNINGVTYFWKERTDQPNRQTGLIAQEVEEVLPEVVNEDENGIKTIAYANMVGLLVEGIKEERAARKSLEARLTKLEELLLKGE